MKILFWVAILLLVAIVVWVGTAAVALYKVGKKKR